MRTEAVEARRRRRIGILGMVAVAAILAVGVTVASYPSLDPTQAIPRLTVAREAVAEAEDRISTVEARVDGQDLVDRDPERAKDLLADAAVALDRAEGAGVSPSALEPLRIRLDGRLDAIYNVARIRELTTVADLASSFTAVNAERMVAASDGSLWILDTGRGRVFRVDPVAGTTEAVYRAGQQLDGGVAGDPWLLATAATDVVIVDRDHHAWRADLVERVPRRMPTRRDRDPRPGKHPDDRSPAPPAARDLHAVRGGPRDGRGMEVDPPAPLSRSPSRTRPSHSSPSRRTSTRPPPPTCMRTPTCGSCTAPP